MTRTTGGRAEAIRHSKGLIGTLAGLLLLTGCGAALGETAQASPDSDATPVEPAVVEVTDAPASEPTATAEAGTALALLAELRIAGRAPKSGYDRDLFEYRSYDYDRNGCDIRNDILRRDLTDILIKPGTNGCVVLTGVLNDPYSGEVISFDREAPNDVQIDHVVALSDAWQKGAQGWDEQTMREFGNDPLNLLAVDGPLNAGKADGDTATWLPPDKSFRCAYVARQVTVKHTYGLWVTQAEHEAMTRILAACPDQPVAERETADLGGPEATQAPTQEPTPQASTHAPATDGDTDPRFGSCKDAKAAGYGPYVSGVDLEYGWYRDGDSDGIVCE
ncbi:GmrSD restriction endonuclease domain-containing protein [Pseudactinotalea terrae]|uniref:GmrSD restriction endonuclease domain-containing protein n=1 Tax=Pseudactinotalea terrae TaxID=1743262 RepID=UPI0012E26606|nr:DUF1524 domain-containing protein [Pseudactinotalea terrae]